MCYWYKAKLKGLVWSLLYSFIVFIPIDIDHVYAIQKGKLMIPTSYTALSGDLHAQLQFKEPPSLTSYTDYYLEINRFKTDFNNNNDNNNNNDDDEKENFDTIRIYPDPRYNITQITIPCHIFYLGGKYELEIIRKNLNNQTSLSPSSTSSTSSYNETDERLKQQLDVRWPYPKLSVTREQIGTYPEEPIIVILTFPEIECEIKNMNNPKISEFWLELIYCGQELCTNLLNETTKSHVLYAEQIRGYTKIKSIKLRCELFGLAGHYIVQLRPIKPTPSYVSAISYIKVDWNEKFVFNVHARSIFPCDPHNGISVLFEYPACILDQADRIRLFAKLRADVASLKPPTSLHYVTEQRVKRGQHAIHFDCDYFSEKYVEYCFVYVTQAISGAVADIRMDCVPTLPVSDSDTGGWGPWSEWTPCSTTCAGGTKNRYRFCDSPPPRYGAKFCEGPAVETERCGKDDVDTWECIYASGGGGSGGVNSITRKSNIESASVIAEIGPGCRCGCIVHLGSSKPKRVIASSAQSCPGRSFWLIQADENNVVNLIIDFFRLPCSTQYIKIRDGDSLASNLLFENIGGTKFDLEKIISSGPQVLIEFFSDEIVTIDTTCNGGFLAHIEQTAPEKQNITSITSRAITQKPQIGTKFTIVHIAAVIFASIIIIISALLGTQYIFRYRKYHLTQNMGEPDSPIHTPRTSIGSLQNPELQNPPSRAVSTNTLLSEVIYLVKIRPKARMKHSILRESIDGENLERETDLNDEIKKSKCIDDVGDNDSGSIGSTHTLTNEILNEENSQYDKDISSYSVNDNESINSKQSTSQIHEEISSIDDITTTKTTTLPKKKIKITDGNTTIKQKQFHTDIKENDTEEIDKSESSSCKKDTNRKKIFLSASNMTLTNGCYSPAASIISTATIRTTNQKESKEKLNRERLARPDSEFSLANPEDLELDYYDYNVVNAGAAPGSYLGMDPAYLVWIPPLDDGNIINEIEIDNTTTTISASAATTTEVEPYYEEILPKYNHIDPGSNTETPETDHAPEPPPMNFSNCNNKYTKSSKTGIDDTFKITQKNSITALLQKDENILKTKNSNTQLTTTIFTTNKNNKIEKNSDTEIIQLHELNEKSNHKIVDELTKNFIRKSVIDTEKETSVVKSPSDLQDYYELDDIQFADDEDDNNEILSSTSNINTNTMNNKSATIKFNTNYKVKT